MGGLQESTQAVLPLQICDPADADHSLLLDSKSKRLGIPPVWMHWY
jgi:hypothetical protein